MKYLSIALVSLFLFTSCIDDLLNTDDPDSISGMWNVEESSSTYGTQYYNVQITEKYENVVNIYNFYGLGSWVFIEADIDDNTVLIEEELLDGYRFSGQGIISDDKQTIDFAFSVEEVSVKKSTLVENVTAVYTK